MILKTLAFILLLYLTVRFVSRLLIPPHRRRKSVVRIIYKTIKNIQQNQQQHDQRRSRPGETGKHFDEVEEAEYEDVTEDKSQAS